MVLFTLYFFVLGSIVGSFLNVLIDRLPKKNHTLLGRSHCVNCKKILSPLELVPLFSYLFLRGKCHKCKADIPFRIFFVEFSTGMFFSVIYLHFLLAGYSLQTFIYLLIIVSSSIAIFFTDLEYGIIPDEILFATGVTITAYTLLFAQNELSLKLLSAFAAFSLFFLLFLFTKGRGMGFGDVKLSFIIGFFLSFPRIVAGLYLAFLTGAVVSIILVIWKKKSFKKGTIPFGPFLIASMLVAYFFGNQILISFFQFFS
ncbi:MAG: prepilin peptidase [Candidatus Levybacteria bacterium CG_4_10_14_0_2_um_filter_36_16]|nr:MAG: hypothetical protein AUK12_04055 [Candidatus Levybacteria bacterium CG2_30_37_29]PIR79633.1 MAG: prepilin peptidase [Candidatus Levybacteria bacterium CG10_big_fil_rev_8_21_14_0_10_36_30]PIZ97765.1 MAG: prepilin peptidase [Candidatus Levybacteria bacterium CG_4_10_14_0_2_um_filter_36_16]PJA90633.1 MAG: prepilin peptidase [Candidatus Levybacteria bacterium CG_4_9_14_3_um_filter_36_7]